MSDNSKIQWTHHTASPWHGCTHGVYLDADGNEHEHPGCMNCYAELGAKRNPGTLGVWGPNGTRVMSASFHANCIRWNKEAELDGVIRSVFPSICDPFEQWDGPILNSKGERFVLYKPNGGILTKAAYIEDPPAHCRWLTMNDLRRFLFAIIDTCPHLRFLLLTKRPENVGIMWPAFFPGGYTAEAGAMNQEGPRPNVAIITSVSDQATANSLTPFLIECRNLCPILGLSYEPAIGPVDLTRIEIRAHGAMPNDLSRKHGDWINPLSGLFRDSPTIDWVIIGGESGHGARPFVMDWGMQVIKDCRKADVAVFMKQVGGNPMINDNLSARGVTTSIWGPIKDKKGGEIDEWPIDLRVRQFPKAMAL